MFLRDVKGQTLIRRSWVFFLILQMPKSEKLAFINLGYSDGLETKVNNDKMAFRFWEYLIYTEKSEWCKTHFLHCKKRKIIDGLYQV